MAVRLCKVNNKIMLEGVGHVFLLNNYNKENFIKVENICDD